MNTARGKRPSKRIADLDQVPCGGRASPATYLPPCSRRARSDLRARLCPPCVTSRPIPRSPQSTPALVPARLFLLCRGEQATNETSSRPHRVVASLRTDKSTRRATKLNQATERNRRRAWWLKRRACQRVLLHRRRSMLHGHRSPAATTQRPCP